MYGSPVIEKRSQNFSKTARAAAVLSTLVLLPQCQDKVAEKKASEAPALVAPPTPKSAATPKKDPPGHPGKWVDAVRFRLRVLDVWPCDVPRDATATAPSTGAPASSAESPALAKSGKFRLGVMIEVEATDEAKLGPVIASPKAATLEKEGKVFYAIPKPTPTPACQELLGFQELRAGESTRGVLMFEAPNEDYLRSAVLAFKPPRWGGEAQLEVRLPDCFGPQCCSGPECSDAGAPEASKAQAKTAIQAKHAKKDE